MPSKTRIVMKPQSVEKLYFVQFGQVRRHSRVLYLPLDPVTVRLHKIKKGDIIKYQLLELRRAPDEDARLEES
jgi:hypothetical protein